MDMYPPLAGMLRDPSRVLRDPQVRHPPQEGVFEKAPCFGYLRSPLLP